MAANRVLKLTNRGVVDFYEESASGSDKISVQPPAALAASWTFTLPPNKGTLDQLLRTDGNGVTTWVSSVPAFTVTDLSAESVTLLDSGEVRLREDAVNGTEYVGLRAPAAVLSSIVFELPGTDGAANTLLKTDGALGLSFVSTIPAFDVDALTSDQITVLNQGELRLREASGGGTNYTGFRAPTALGGDLMYTLPSAIVASAFLQTDGTGNLQWATSTATLQSSYTGGEDVTFASGKTSTWTSAQNEDMFVFNKTVAGAGICLTVDNDGTGHACYIKQDGAGNALHIDCGAATGVVLDQANDNVVLDINKTGIGSGHVVTIDNAGTGYGLYIGQAGAQSGFVLSQSGGAIAAQITQSQNFTGLYVNKTGSGAGSAAYINNDGTGIGLYIDQNGAAIGLRVLQDGAASASKFSVTVNQHVLELEKTGAGAGNMIEISNSGTGYDISGHNDNFNVTPQGGIKACGLYFTATSKTIATDAIIVDRNDCFIRLDTEGGAGTDDLDTITGGTDGQILILKTTANTRDVNVKNGGNITVSGTPRTLDTVQDTIMLIYSSADLLWLELSFANN